MGAGQSCTGCHTHLSGFSPAGGQAVPPHDTQPFVDNCDYCHVEDGAGSIDFAALVPDTKCEQCHTPSGILKSGFPTAPDVITHGDTACVGCHDPMFEQTNLNLVRSTVSGSFIPDSRIVFTALSGPGSFADGPPFQENVCETCHNQTNHHQADGTAPSGQSHYDGEDCTQCHPHSSGFEPTGGIAAPPHDTQPFVDNCDYCHVEDGAGHIDFAARIPDSKCEQCHTPDGALKDGFPTAPDVVTHSGEASETGKYVYDNLCVDCHNPMYEQANLRGIRSTLGRSVISGSEIDFTRGSGAGSFADGLPFNENLCETCHTQTDHHRYNGSGPGDSHGGDYTGHLDNQDCSACHKHRNAFVPDFWPPSPPHNQFDCSACHGVDEEGFLLEEEPFDENRCFECHDL